MFSFFADLVIVEEGKLGWSDESLLSESKQGKRSGLLLRNHLVTEETGEEEKEEKEESWTTELFLSSGTVVRALISQYQEMSSLALYLLAELQ
jgi:hypothetical protein